MQYCSVKVCNCQCSGQNHENSSLSASDKSQFLVIRTVLVADGGNGLREALQAKFPNLTFILDRPHLKQHLYSGAKAMGLTDVERHKWVSDKLHIIDAGDVRQVIKSLKGYHAQGKERITNLSGYLKRFIDAVDYNYFRAKGLPIGSGEVESAHRYIPQKRLKIPGATWHPDTINPMLALRIVRANGWWDDFWTKQSAFHEKLNTRKSPFV
jgi:hypothetical protein